MLLVPGAYLYGSIPFGFIMARIFKGVDIRNRGSGNIGATNAARVLGFRFFPLIFLLDFSKGFLSAYMGLRVFSGFSGFTPPPLAVICALAAVAGHIFPVFLGFKGGKAVAAGTGAFVVLAPWAVLAAAVVWAILFSVFRYVSLASIIAAVTLGTAVWVPPVNPEPLGEGVFLTFFATFAALMIIFLHRSNIGRLLSGSEHRIGREQSPGGSS